MATKPVKRIDIIVDLWEVQQLEQNKKVCPSYNGRGRAEGVVLKKSVGWTRFS